MVVGWVAEGWCVVFGFVRWWQGGLGQCVSKRVCLEVKLAWGLGGV